MLLKCSFHGFTKCPRKGQQGLALQITSKFEKIKLAKTFMQSTCLVHSVDFHIFNAHSKTYSWSLLMMYTSKETKISVQNSALHCL